MLLYQNQFSLDVNFVMVQLKQTISSKTHANMEQDDGDVEVSIELNKEPLFQNNDFRVEALSVDSEIRNERSVESVEEEMCDRAELKAPPPSHEKNNLPRLKRIGRYQMIAPIIVAAVLCVCMISSTLRPYEVILERRLRPMNMRRIFGQNPFFSSVRSSHRLLENDDAYYNNSTENYYDYNATNDDIYYNTTDDEANATEYYDDDDDQGV